MVEADVEEFSKRNVTFDYVSIPPMPCNEQVARTILQVSEKKLQGLVEGGDQFVDKHVSWVGAAFSYGAHTLIDKVPEYVF